MDEAETYIHYYNASLMEAAAFWSLSITPISRRASCWHAYHPRPHKAHGRRVWQHYSNWDATGEAVLSNGSFSFLTARYELRRIPQESLEALPETKTLIPHSKSAAPRRRRTCVS